AGTGFCECPECGNCYEPDKAVCDSHSVELQQVRFSRVLSTRYRLERRRGRGGMGTVYEATDTELQRRVAVKLIREEWIDSVEAVQRFRREAIAVANFTHPNVVTIYDFGVDEQNHAFLVMELLHGVTLGDEIRASARLTPARIVQVFRGVCVAVKAAHERGL